MGVLGAHSYDTFVEFKREEHHEKKLKRWWGTFSRGVQALLWQFLGGITALLHTRLDWYLLEVITSCWPPTLRCITIGDVDLVPTLEEYDRFLSLSTPVSIDFIPPMRTRYRKNLANLMGFKRPVVEVLTWHGSGVGGSMSFKFLHDRFHLPECPVGT